MKRYFDKKIEGQNLDKILIFSSKKWIAGTLSVIALGGMLYIGPAVSYAADSQTAAANTWQRGAATAMGRVQNSMIDFISSLIGMDKTAIIQEMSAGWGD